MVADEAPWLDEKSTRRRIGGKGTSAAELVECEHPRVKCTETITIIINTPQRLNHKDLANDLANDNDE